MKKLVTVDKWMYFLKHVWIFETHQFFEFPFYNFIYSLSKKIRKNYLGKSKILIKLVPVDK